MHKDQVPGVDFTLLIAGPAVPGVLAADAAYSGSTGPGKDPFLVQYLCTGRRFVWWLLRARHPERFLPPQEPEIASFLRKCLVLRTLDACGDTVLISYTAAC
jgi:hypothetical protein